MNILEGGTIVETTSNGERRPGTSTHGDRALPAYLVRKAWLVRIAGSLLLALASPLILLLVIVVRMTSAGPGLYRQQRTGRHGKRFTMYKIRTMYNDAELVSGPVWCVPGDSRITPVGKILRLLHLDELPQLINVARGDMDLVGPRPERPVFVARLAREIPNYHARLEVLPGVTGLAQVNLPPDESVDCVRRKLVLDCAYIHEASPGLDLRILLCTFLRMLGIRHGRAVRWMRLERDIHLPEEEHQDGRDLSHWPLHAPYQSTTAAHLYPFDHANRLAVAAAVARENGSAAATTLEETDSPDIVPLRRPR